MDRLDQASLRRFTLKLRFAPLNLAQEWWHSERFFGIVAPRRLADELTPGDFTTVRRKRDLSASSRRRRWPIGSSRRPRPRERGYDGSALRPPTISRRNDTCSRQVPGRVRRSGDTVPRPMLVFWPLFGILLETGTLGSDRGDQNSRAGARASCLRGPVRYEKAETIEPSRNWRSISTCSF